MQTPVCFTPIGRIRSCFREKFGTPRQAGLVPEARAVLVLPSTAKIQDALRGLEQFSHLWVLFVFDRLGNSSWKPLVRPPRLGGSRKVGVFASRSPHRPNPIGLSAVTLEKIVTRKKEIELHLRGGDFVDGTPVLDIKPYLPYADAVPRARAGWAEGTIPKLRVRFAPAVLRRCRELEAGGYPKLTELIRQTVSLDPRPAFQRKSDGASYAARLSDFDVAWEVRGKSCEVTGLTPT